MPSEDASRTAWRTKSTLPATRRRESSPSAIGSKRRWGAEVWRSLERFPEALALSERILAETTAESVRGLILGFAYELRAWVAIVQADGEAFYRFADLCADEYTMRSWRSRLGHKTRMIQHVFNDGTPLHVRSRREHLHLSKRA